MARGIQNKVNTDAPDGNYPFGKIRDDDGSNNGTPVDEQTYGDWHQFFESLMARAGLTFNGLPDNVGNTFQLLLAFIGSVRATFATETDRGTAEIATTAETTTGTDDTRMVTPKKLADWWDAKFNQAWTLRSNIADVSVTGGSGTTVTNSNIKYKVREKTVHVNYRFQVSNTTAPTVFLLTLPSPLVNATGFTISGDVLVLNNATQVLAQAYFNDAGAVVTIIPATTLTNGTTTTVSGSLTFEIA